MRVVMLFFVLLAFQGCASPGVQPLNLRDPRLPLEARRWLADAEDEVAIARARVDEAEAALEKLEAYRESLVVRLAEMEAGAATRARSLWSESLTASFTSYTDQRIGLEELELDVATRALELARARLTLARAETAMRYDVAVYEIEPLAREVARLRTLLAGAEREVEEQRANVERTADECWKTYAQFVRGGGVTNALWRAPQAEELK